MFAHLLPKMAMQNLRQVDITVLFTAIVTYIIRVSSSTKVTIMSRRTNAKFMHVGTAKDERACSGDRCGRGALELDHSDPIC